MRIAYVAGFFAPVEKGLEALEPTLFESKSTIWIRQRPDRQPDLNQLKADLFDKATRGAVAILICLFVFRGQERALISLNEIIRTAKGRFPDLSVDIERLKNGQDTEAVLASVRRFGPSFSRVFPDDLSDLAGWAAKRLGSRLVLHPRAIRAAKDSLFSNNRLIFAALDLLANEYWESRMANQASAPRCSGAFTNKLNSLGIDLAPSISASRAGEEGQDYFVKYPVGSDTTRMLDLHLRFGSDRDKRNCLRIYFFWDADSKQVVVGSLPGHLGTRSS